MGSRNGRYNRGFPKPSFSVLAPHPILEELKGLDVDDLTPPRDALNLLGEWKKKIEE